MFAYTVSSESLQIYDHQLVFTTVDETVHSDSAYLSVVGFTFRRTKRANTRPGTGDGTLINPRICGD